MWLTSLTGTDSSAATAARPSSSNGRPEVSSMRARRRRKLKNSVLWAAVVPVRTIDQLRRIKSCIAERIHHERSEEQTSALQSLMRRSYPVFCLKKTQIKKQ